MMDFALIKIDKLDGIWHARYYPENAGALPTPDGIGAYQIADPGPKPTSEAFDVLAWTIWQIMASEYGLAHGKTFGSA